MWRARAFLSCCLLFSGCGAAEGTAADLRELDEGARDYAQGCDWRQQLDVRAELELRHPESCYFVHTGPPARLSEQDFANPCDAQALSMSFLLRPDRNGPVFGYFDRGELDAFKAVRYERLEFCP